MLHHLLRQDATEVEGCALIDVEKARCPITQMRSLLGVARSTRYDWYRQVATVTATAARRAELTIDMSAVFADF